ncbi:DgyrCDS2982 [Dimorphilus gyrociliatus]|uniref:DgyrCDS2982 n=1 Tax=Dimorphilus gyrociliatus TaxID=2664684 RepID=A0A7I8VC09_9ANNE|nr:DgyrCDS2982 [Dimorphilus gyrociliatus]
MLKYFNGYWKWSRRVTSLGTNTILASVSDGNASFAPFLNSQSLLYREIGHLENFESLSASGGTVTRQYIYTFNDENVIVFHCSASDRGNVDPRSAPNAENFTRLTEFHRFKSNTTTAECVHICIDDKYTGLYNFVSDAKFELQWTVIGPNKNYKIKKITWQKVALSTNKQLQKKYKISEFDCKHLRCASESCVTVPPLRTAKEYLSMNEQYYMSTGCDIINEYLKGGIPRQGITEITGESGCGKTQLSLQLSLIAQLPSSKGGLDGMTVYIETEGKFAHARLRQLAESISEKFGVNVTKLQSNVLVRECKEVDDLVYCISTLLKNIIKDRPIKLIIIDSIAALFRSEFSYSESIARAEKLNKIGVCLKEYSANYGTVVVCTNQVSANIKEHGREGELNVKPALGLAWSNLVTTRLMMRRLRSTDATSRFINVIYSPLLPSFLFSSCNFIIEKSGVKGVPNHDF